MAYRQLHTAPDIFLIESPRDEAGSHITNCYLFRDAGDAVLVDVGYNGFEPQIQMQKALRDLEIDHSRLSVVLTHLHLDHAGQIDVIATGSTPVYVSAYDYGLKADKAASAHPRMVYKRLLMEGVSQKEADSCASMISISYAVPSDERHDVRRVHDGDRIPFGRYTLRIVETPGHTPGHIAVYCDEAKTLCTGDAVLTNMSTDIDLHPVGHDGYQAHLDSLRKMRSMDIELMLCGHGPIIENHYERLDRELRHHRMRLERTWEFIQEEPGATGIEVILSMGWSAPIHHWSQINPVNRTCILKQGMSILHHLVFAGLVRCVVEEDGLRHYYPIPEERRGDLCLI